MYPVGSWCPIAQKYAVSRGTYGRGTTMHTGSMQFVNSRVGKHRPHGTVGAEQAEGLSACSAKQPPDLARPVPMSHADVAREGWEGGSQRDSAHQCGGDALTGGWGPSWGTIAQSPVHAPERPTCVGGFSDSNAYGHIGALDRSRHPLCRKGQARARELEREPRSGTACCPGQCIR